MEIKEVQIEQTSLSSPKEFVNRNEEKNLLWNAGIKVNGHWHNCTFWNKRQAEKFKNLNQGDIIKVLLYSEKSGDKIYYKFKFPTREDYTEVRLRNLEKFMRLTLENNSQLKALYQNL